MSATELLPQPPLDHGCEECGAGPAVDCHPLCTAYAAAVESMCPDCGAPGTAECRRTCPARGEPCGCWDPLCGECMRRLHAGERPSRPVRGGITY